MSTQRKLISIMGGVALMAAMLGPAPAEAVPILGVSTSNTYLYGDPPEPYQGYWNGNSFAPAAFDTGFIVNSGDTLNLWVEPNGDNVGGLTTTQLLTSDLYLLTNGVSQGDISNVQLDGTQLLPTPGDAFNDPIDGYQPHPPPNYSGVLIGPVFAADGSLNSGWSLVSSYNPAGFGTSGYSAQAYYYSGVITFDGVLDGDDHFWTYLDIGGDGGFNNGNDPFAPKTTSGVGVPEPGSLILMGGGLLGLALWSRRRARA